eukprot:TRINITY_DN42701_c0_g1_i1.p1 TRINITY_DN42701_c0_g1~~TRINITY_DN42701_c0_g1_i1.p1  ORF type:complete len:117 (+),score=11.10 TRINITY_DN42701_c0_g1_i1:113-463(+)
MSLLTLWKSKEHSEMDTILPSLTSLSVAAYLYFSSFDELNSEKEVSQSHSFSWPQTPLYNIGKKRRIVKSEKTSARATIRACLSACVSRSSSISPSLFHINFSLPSPSSFLERACL